MDFHLKNSTDLDLSNTIQDQSDKTIVNIYFYTL